MKLIYDSRLGYQYRRVSPAQHRAVVACCIVNMVARLITFCWVHIAAGFLNFPFAGVKYNEIVELGVLTGMNLLTIGILTLSLVPSLGQNVITFLNGMYLFNRRLATHFGTSEHLESDGLEPTLWCLRYGGWLGVAGTPLALMIGIGGRVTAMKDAVALGTWLTASRWIPVSVMLIGGLYMFTLDIVLNILNILNIFIGANFMYRWLQVHARAPDAARDHGNSAGSHDNERRLQILYRAHQIWFRFVQEFGGPTIPPMVISTCFMTITGFTGMIKFGHGLGPVVLLGMVGVTLVSLGVQQVTIEMANRFRRASEEYIKKGKAAAVHKQRLVDIKFYKSCQPLK